MSKPKFSEMCESVGNVLLKLAEQSKDCTEPVRFDRDAFQPNIQMIADLLSEFAKVKLEKF